PAPTSVRAKVLLAPIEAQSQRWKAVDKSHQLVLAPHVDLGLSKSACFNLIPDMRDGLIPLRSREIDLREHHDVPSAPFHARPHPWRQVVARRGSVSEQLFLDRCLLPRRHFASLYLERTTLVRDDVASGKVASRRNLGVDAAISYVDVAGYVGRG